MRDQGTEREIVLRYVVELLDQIPCFQPTSLTDEEMAATHVKHAIVGAALVGHFDNLPVKNASVIFEVEMALAPLAMLKPLKAKLWLMRRVQLEPGKFYLLD